MSIDGDGQTIPPAARNGENVALSGPSVVH